MRDRNLDIYRGGIMIYITCFCHLIWWEGVKVGIFERSWITGIFFAMATVFYIVGASFSPVIGKNVSDLFERSDKKSCDPLLEVCIGLFSGCCVSLFEVGSDNTVEWLYILCVLYPYGGISIIWSYLVYSALLDYISLPAFFMWDDSQV